MITSIYITNILVVGLMMLLGWIYSIYRRNVTIVDSLWGMGFILIAWMTWFQADGFEGRKLLLAGLTTLWGLRLTLYLTLRNHGKEEDPRYVRWRRESGRMFWLSSLFKVFLLQALFLWGIALVVQAGQTRSDPAFFVWTDIIGAFIWLVGFVFESVSDAQLASFKSNPANRGKVMARGLWRYTRHPNYFGECLIWWGLFVIAMADLHLWWTVVSPVIVTVVLLKMTGIPLTEKLLVEKRPGYDHYIHTTPAFFPWIPKRTKQTVEVSDE